MNKYSFRIFWSDEDEGYIFTSPEFPSLSAFGDSYEESLREGQIALAHMIEGYIENGVPLPEPYHVEQYSGQFRVRLPKSLHAQAAELAADDGVSLNQLVVSAVEQRVGAKLVGNRMLAEMKQLFAEQANQNRVTLATIASALTSNQQRLKLSPLNPSETANAKSSGSGAPVYLESGGH